VAVAFSSASTGDVVITAASGATIVRNNGWSYVAPASVDSISPTTGQIGTRITISGSGLLVGGSEIDELQLAGAAVQEVVSASETAIVVIAATNGSASTGIISYTMTSGAAVESASSVTWTYLEASVIDAVTPNSGRQGTAVLITGSNMLGGGASITIVTLAGESADVASGNDTHVAVVAVASDTAGLGHVVVTANTGAVTTAEGAWTYLASSIDSIEPNSGQLNTLVTIQGAGMIGGGDSLTAATIADRAATIVSANDTYIVLRASSSTLDAVGAEATGAIVLTAASGAVTSSTDSAFVYLFEGNITSVSPAVGPGFQVVTIQGTALLGGRDAVASVTLGGNDAEVESESETAIVVTAAIASSGTELYTPLAVVSPRSPAPP